MTTVSKVLIDRIKLSDTPLYRLAWDVAKCHPETLSRLLNGAARVRPNDPRIIAVGGVLGVKPEDCFAEAQDGGL